MCFRGPHHPNAVDRNGRPITPEESQHLYFLRVSKTIHAECGLLYYSHNTFHADTLLGLLRFINRDLSVLQRRAIARVIVGWEGTRPALAMKTLHTCVGLRHLEVRFRDVTASSLPRHWAHIQGIRDLLKLRGIVGLVLLEDEHGRFLEDFEGWEELLEVAEVVKQPRTRASLRLQYKKDFPGSG